uniref:Pentacotripeptide-repeat region of PRORP domain-containing protein n=1 Tax=Rhodosorus marinus TaxID=101924 RepID=A0A7S3E700_9RHOD|mmetsp:Transcript_14221/g.57253  ORF Transcript_14221/g.57253 Transcript_14221/m.57253 type:complete len:253 (+) Transcript_14221:859-1617(+)
MSWSHNIRVKLDKILRTEVRNVVTAATQEKSTANRMYGIVRVAMDDLRIRDPRLVNRSSEDIKKLVRVAASMGILDLTDRPLNPNIVEGAVLDIGESYSWLCAYQFMKLAYTHHYLKPTPASCSILLRNLCKMDRGEELQELVRIMMEEEIPLGKDLPAVFADCMSSSGENGFGLGLLIFQLLLDRSQLDLLTCDVVFTALLRAGELDKALEVLQTMEKVGLRFREPGKTVEDFWGWLVFTDRRVLPDMHGK